MDKSYTIPLCAIKSTQKQIVPILINAFDIQTYFVMAKIKTFRYYRHENN